MRSRFRNRTFALITIGIMVVAAEIIAYVFNVLVRDGRFAPEPTRKEFVDKLEEQYKAENFDPNLGWVPRKTDREANGARISPDNPVSDRPCVSLYGDSTVFGDEVSHVAAWGNQLAKRIHCKVSNFGVGGYGTDQAYLRFIKNSSDPSSVVVLGILSENIVRNVNQNRAFLYSSAVGPLKPILWLDDAGQLQFIPVPRLTIESHDKYINDPRSLFQKEFFIPDSSYYAEQRVHFPYIINVPKALRYKRIYDGVLFYLIKSPPWYLDFYDPSHPSHALQVTESIADHFVENAKQRAKTPVILFIPLARDIGNFLRTGKWVYAPLYEWCRARGHNCFDSGAAMVEKLGAQHIKEVGLCEYFCTRRFSEQGHYNEKGNVLLAEVSIRYLEPFLSNAKSGNLPNTKE